VTGFDAALEPMEAVETAMPIDAMRTRLLLAEAALQLDCFDLAEANINAATSTDTRIADTGILSDQLATLANRLERAKADFTSDFELTGRELDVFALLGTDLTSRQIGTKLYVSRNTIRTYQQHVYRKLSVNTREEAVVVARSAKLIPERQLDNWPDRDGASLMRSGDARDTKEVRP
jgi:DNA-binding CsgD family transcriptional regulator